MSKRTVHNMETETNTPSNEEKPPSMISRSSEIRAPKKKAHFENKDKKAGIAKLDMSLIPDANKGKQTISDLDIKQAFEQFSVMLDDYVFKNLFLSYF